MSTKLRRPVQATDADFDCLDEDAASLSVLTDIEADLTIALPAEVVRKLLAQIAPRSTHPTSPPGPKSAA